MSVIGIDFGNESCVSALAKKRQVEIVANEVSHRKTPSIVGFTESSRNIGERGLSSQSSNINRTVTEIKRLLGRENSQPELQADCKNFAFPVVALPNGSVGIKINEQGFVPEQIAAALLGHIKTISENYSSTRITDCVISCPPYFSDKQRSALIDSGKIAGLTVLRVMNETTAVALNYGILRTLPEKDPIRVVFIDIGHASTNVAIVRFIQGKLEVLGTASDSSLGGRNFDHLMFSWINEEIKAKYKIDPSTRPKAVLRLIQALKKSKHMLSALREVPLNVDSLMDDVDISFSISRSQFEELSTPLIQRFLAPVKQVLSQTETKVEDVHSIEVVGGCTRVPAIKSIFEKFFNKPPSTTCNADESVARGCALQCAMLSPAFRVRNFEVHDVTSYPIEVC